MIYFNKPNRTIKSPADLRPITSIKNWYKIWETLFATRIENAPNKINFFSERQYGFKKNVSTIDTIEDVVKHMKGSKKYNYSTRIALDAVNWNVIINNLLEKNVNNSIIKMTETLLSIVV